MNKFKRRDFLRSALSGAALASVGGATTLMAPRGFAAAPGFNDYKALVVVFLYGGNDGFNTIVPIGTQMDGTGYSTYSESRGAIAISDNELCDFSAGANSYTAQSDDLAYSKGVYGFDDQVGINGMMPEFAQLYADQNAAVVANIGSLIEPVTKSTLQSAQLPPFLFAHNHQQRAMETGWADNLAAGGWAGRLADLWEAHLNGVNDGSPLGLNVSFGGATRMMTADFNSPTVISPGTTRLFGSSNGFDTELFKTLNETPPGIPPLHRVLRTANHRAAVLSDILTDQLSTVTDFSDLSDPYGNPMFTNPEASQIELQRRLRGHLLRGLHSAARMVALGRDVLSLNRQIIFVGMGGFDNHSEIARNHPYLLREISLGLWDFQQAMASLGAENEVTLCTLTDFGRTLSNNGDGTDHAWAGHNLVVGGGVDGGRMVGNFPDMTLGGDSDTSSHANSRGRMIPTIAVDQYLASLCSWFGVSDGDMPGLFPNLSNFRSDSAIRSAYLDLMGERGAVPVGGCEESGGLLDGVLPIDTGLPL